MLLFDPGTASTRVRLLALTCALPALITGAIPAPAQPRPRHSTAVVSPPAANRPSEEWLGVYLAQKKVGYSVTRVSPANYESRPALRESGHTVTRLQMLGAKVEEDEVSESITDLKHRPLMQTLDVTSNGSVMHVEARFDYSAHKVYCTLGTGAQATRKTLDIPPGANLTTDTNSLTQGRDLAPGKKYVFTYLQPLSMELRTATLDVTGKARVRTDAGAETSAFEVRATMPEGTMIGWAAPDGSLIKSELKLGPVSITMVRETRVHAIDMAYLSPAMTPAVAGAPAVPVDFADATAIKPDRALPEPRKLGFLKVSISGIPEHNLVPSDDRQTTVRAASKAADDVTAEITVRAEQFSPDEASQWPVKDSALAPYLTRAAYLETDDTSLQKTALTLRGSETNLYKIATGIRDWVHSEMTPDASIGVMRSAKDVYTRRRGVCRDYATLYTALARAAGIPTRLCAGIVYADGRFFYHAWAESYVGRWVAFDPTLYEPGRTRFVDATHIKFAQGDVTQMFDVVSIVGRLKIHVVEADSASRGSAAESAAGL